jgi:hypothetical protein
VPDVTQLINIAILVLGLLFVLLALVYFVRGIQARSGTTGKRYNVGRQQARMSMVGAWFRAGLLGLLGVVLLLIGGVSMLPAGNATAEPDAIGTPLVTTEPTITTTIDAGSENEAGSMPTPTPTTAIPEVVVTTVSSNQPPPTFTPIPTTATPESAAPDPQLTPEEETVNSGVRVNSPNGLYLRAAPGGEVVELIDNEAVVIVLEGTQTVDDIEWWFVRAISGNEGWVAASFLLTE